MTLAIVQVHAPHTEASHLDIKMFFNQIQQAQTYFSKYLIIMGDFNTRIGHRLPGEENILGNYCYEKEIKEAKSCSNLLGL